MAAMLSSAQGVSHALERLFHSKEEISIGRNPSNTIVLNATISREKPIPDSLVLQLSRHHAKLAVKDGELQIMDNSTLNGTFINNLRIPARTWRVLKNGDVISLGGTNPLELEGVVEDNPWTFKVRSPEQFLARYVAPSSLPNAETQSQGGGTRGAEGRAREVYSFTAGREELTRNLGPTVHARKNSPAGAEVIDLTLVEDSPPRAAAPDRPKSKANHTSGPDNKRARLDSAANNASLASAAAGDGAVANGVVEEFTCPICQELIISAYSVVPCGHNFCGACLSEWLATKQDCPNCRQRCTAPPLRANAVDNIIALTVKELDDNDKKVYEDRKKEWGQTKTAIEQKLKNSVKSGGGGASGSDAYGRGMPMLAMPPFLGLVPGMMGSNGAVPGMDYLLQGYPGGRPSLLQVEDPRNHQRQSQVRRAQTMGEEQSFRCQYAGAAAGWRCKECCAVFSSNDLILGMKTLPARARSGRYQNNGFNWYHFRCFPQAGFRNARVVGFENMRHLSSSDASRIRERLANS